MSSGVGTHFISIDEMGPIATATVVLAEGFIQVMAFKKYYQCPKQEVNSPEPDVGEAESPCPELA